MSRAREIDCVCPHCRSRNRIEVWAHVDAVMDPNLAYRIIDGSLFEFECRGCGEINALEHSIRFEDAERRIAYWCDLPDGLVSASDALIGGEGADYRLRRVTDSNAFKEMVHLWRDELDDAAMLLLKHMAACRLQDEVGIPPVVCSYDRKTSESGREVLEFIVYMTETSDPETLSIPMELCRDLARSLQPHKRDLMPNGRWIDWNGETAQRLSEAMEAQPTHR